MSQLITLSKLSSLVSDYTGIELTLCESFIRNMAQAAVSGLAEGEHIRIKNLGLFEVRNSPDGSVSVDFVPETAFAERVNAPFAHLCPTEIPKRPAAAAPSGPQRPGMPTPGASVPQPTSSPITPPRQPAMPQDTGYTQPEKPAYPDQRPEYPMYPSSPTQQQGGAPDLPAYLNYPSAGQSQMDPKPDPIPDTPSTDRSHPSGYGRQLPRLSTNKKYVLIGAIGIIVGFVLGYLTARYSSSDSQDSPTSAQETPGATDIAQQEASTQPLEPQFDYESSLSVANEDPMLEDNENIDTPEAQTAPQPVTVKLQKGERLSDIAQKHYGKKEYWVYIYEENSKTITNPFTIREGTTLVIPPKDKYAPSTDEAYNLNRAKSRAAEINQKYVH